MMIWQSYLIYKQEFSRTKDGGGAPATPVPFLFRIAIQTPYSIKDTKNIPAVFPLLKSALINRVML